VSGAAGPTRGGGSLRDIEARTRASARTPAQPVPLSALAGLDGGQQPSG
jgi:hypothetical protein